MVCNQQSAETVPQDFIPTISSTSTRKDDSCLLVPSEECNTFEHDMRTLHCSTAAPAVSPRDVSHSELHDENSQPRLKRCSNRVVGNGCCHRQHQRRYNVVSRVVLCASLGSLVFGYNIAVLNISADTIAVEYGWCKAYWDTECRKAMVYRGLSRAGLFIGAPFGSVLGGYRLPNGRRQLYLETAFGLGVGTISSVSANSFSALFWARIITGIAVGMVAVVVPTYISEMSPSGLRGYYGVFHQLSITLGIFLAHAFGLVLSTVPPTADEQSTAARLSSFDKAWWRCMFGLQAIPILVIIYALFAKFTFETPRFYVQNGCFEDAKRVQRIMNATGDITDEFLILRDTEARAQTALRSGLTFWKAMRVPIYRRVIGIGCLLSVFQQLSGINAYISSSYHLFKRASLNPALITLIATLMTLLHFFMTIPAAYLIESIGRRSLLLYGCVGMGVSVLPAAIALIFAPNTPATTWLAIAGIVSFLVIYAGTYGPVLWVYLYEIYPVEIKETGSSLATIMHWITSVVVIYTFELVPLVVTFWLCSGSCFTAAAFVCACIKETRGRSVEQSPYTYDGDKTRTPKRREPEDVAETS